MGMVYCIGLWSQLRLTQLITLLFSIVFSHGLVWVAWPFKVYKFRVLVWDIFIEFVLMVGKIIRGLVIWLGIVLKL